MVAWEMQDSNEKRKQLKKLDICFDSLNPYLETMRYCYGNFSALKWIVTNKILFQRNNSTLNHWGIQNMIVAMQTMREEQNVFYCLFNLEQFSSMNVVT